MAAQVAPAVLAAPVEWEVRVATLRSNTQNVLALATSLLIRIPEGAAKVLPVAYLETQETAERAAMLFRAAAHQVVIWPFPAQPVHRAVLVEAAPRARLVVMGMLAPSLAP